MKSLKQIINRYIRSAAIVMALVILVVIAFAEILIEQGRVDRCRYICASGADYRRTGYSNAQTVPGAIPADRERI